jgi:hypothetical protein
MESLLFAPESFVYDRAAFPLFFPPVHSLDPLRQTASVQRVAREYYQRGSTSGTTHLNCLSNGMTLGEYAMLEIVTRNHRRRQKS